MKENKRISWKYPLSWSIHYQALTMRVWKYNCKIGLFNWNKCELWLKIFHIMQEDPYNSEILHVSVVQRLLSRWLDKYKFVQLFKLKMGASLRIACKSGNSDITNNCKSFHARLCIFPGPYLRFSFDVTTKLRCSHLKADYWYWYDAFEAPSRVGDIRFKFFCRWNHLVGVLKVAEFLVKFM